MKQTDSRLLLLADEDNILVLTGEIAQGEPILVDGKTCEAPQSLGLGHKLARHDIAKGEQVLKYGLPIGCAREAIARGSHVHIHNLRSDYTAVELME